MKALGIPLGLIFTSFFYFPFYFTFFPETNTKMIVALMGLVWLLVRMGNSGDRMISKDFFMISLYALGRYLQYIYIRVGDNFSQLFVHDLE